MTKAETEVRELLAKLEHLRDVLLAEDLDFQLKLARLRQIRESLGQLERIVKEERRDLGWSRFAVDQRKARERLAARRPDLEALARDQAAVLADTKAIPPDREADARRKRWPALKGLRDREAALGKVRLGPRRRPAVRRLPAVAAPQGRGPAGRRRGPSSTSTTSPRPSPPRSGPPPCSREELGRLDGRIAEADRDVAEAEFRRHEADQLRNRRAADALGAGSAAWATPGSLQKDLIRAGELDAGRREGPGEVRRRPRGRRPVGRAGDPHQVVARTSAQAAEKLAGPAADRAPARIVAELTEMHESQASIRETTPGPGPSAGPEVAHPRMIAVTNLSQKEGELAEPRPSTCWPWSRRPSTASPCRRRSASCPARCGPSRARLKDGDASAADRRDGAARIEDDLLGLLQAIRRLPPTTPPPPGSPLPSDPRERERELNRLVAELKMIRLLQSRLNDDTVGVDKTRPAAPALPPGPPPRGRGAGGQPGGDPRLAVEDRRAHRATLSRIRIPADRPSMILVPNPFSLVLRPTEGTMKRDVEYPSASPPCWRPAESPAPATAGRRPGRRHRHARWAASSTTWAARRPASPSRASRRRSSATWTS